MSIGLPAHLRQQSVSRAFALTATTIACACLALALVAVLSTYASDTTMILWPAALAIVPLIITTWLAGRYRTKLFSVANLLIGGPAIYWLALTVLSQLNPLGDAGQYLLDLPSIALMLIGGVGLSTASAILWCTIGMLVAEAAVLLASYQVLGRPDLELTVFITYVAVVALLITLRLSQRGVRLVQSNLHRAARDDEMATFRYGIEATSAAMMHDTVLGHLAAIAHAPYGAMSAQLQAQIARDLEVLVGEEWLSDTAKDSNDGARTDWQNSELLAAITEVRDMGLEVEVTGDLTAISLLSGQGASALGPAVKQCLVNVIKHAGVLQAEVAIFASTNEVSVLVVDAGKGFEESETGEDRLGLRQSVRRRIELVAGTVQVWSTPGRGTSVMIRVPTAASEPDGTKSVIQ